MTGGKVKCNVTMCWVLNIRICVNQRCSNGYMDCISWKPTICSKHTVATCTTEETCSDITSNSFISLGIPPSSRFANKASLSIRDMIIFFMLTFSWRSAHAWRNLLRVRRWNSSGKTCMTHSMRYSWAIGSRQLTVCSNTPGRTFCLKKEPNQD